MLERVLGRRFAVLTCRRGDGGTADGAPRRARRRRLTAVNPDADHDVQNAFMTSRTPSGRPERLQDVQNAFVNRTRTGMISIRPIHIRAIITARVLIGNVAKLPYGPAAPKAGPMLRNVVAAAPSASNSVTRASARSASTTLTTASRKKITMLKRRYA